VIRALMPMLLASGDAVVVNVSSISAFTGSGSNIAYCASKAALDTMTMSLARVFGPGVRFLCVSPGAVATDFVAGRDRAALEKAAASTPLRRVVEPEDVAQAVMACVTHLRASTGTRIVVDGGRHL
jgi:3-oxoacyl-[acyl-carrier protein] reductase